MHGVSGHGPYCSHGEALQAASGTERHASEERKTKVNEMDEGNVEERVRIKLAEPRMNHKVSLPGCMCLEPPRIVSYSEVGDPEGSVAFIIFGMDSHRYLTLPLDEDARSRGLRLICLDRPGRGFSSDYEDKRASRVMEFPEILRAFCKAKDIQAFALVGQSLGASYALRCAQEMPDMVATTVYLVSPWIPLSAPGTNRSLAFVERLPSWLIKGGITVGTALPRLLASAGGVNLMSRGCSEAEAEVFTSKFTTQVLKAVLRVKESSNGVALDAITALEKEQPLGFHYRDVSMPVHIFHGRNDQMVPFAAAQWMAEEMPACTLSVKVGGTHALWMDKSIIGCIFDFMSKDFKHFAAQAVDDQKTSASGKGPTFSFPAHTQWFQAEGELLCRQGVLLKSWESRFFMLEGYQLHEFHGSIGSTARRVVDLRGVTARVPSNDREHRPTHQGSRIFPFALEDSKHRVIYELAAASTGDRAYWVETLTKASRFSKGTEDKQRDGALSKRLLVTTRPERRRGLAAKGQSSSNFDQALLYDDDPSARRISLPAGGLAAALAKMSESTESSSFHGSAAWGSKSGANTPRDKRRGRGVFAEPLHGTPRRRPGPGQKFQSFSMKKLEGDNE